MQKGDGPNFRKKRTVPFCRKKRTVPFCMKMPEPIIAPLELMAASNRLSDRVDKAFFKGPSFLKNYPLYWKNPDFSIKYGGLSA
jgi:hypothetical protein